MKLQTKILDRILLIATLLISVGAFIYFYLHGQENLSNYDALARLNIARKIIDSISPGVGQLGAVWLPFPIVLMIPFIWNSFLWHTGLAGAIISEISFIAGAFFLQKTAYLLTKNLAASIITWFIFVANINILLFQTMAMSESLFLFSMIMTLYFLTKWVMDKNIISFLSAAFFVMVGTLTRYEGYFILICSMLFVFIKLAAENWKRKNYSKIEGMLLVFLTIAGFGIYIWCLYNFLFFKDPMYWLHVYTGETSAISSTAPAQNTVTDSFFSYFEVTVWMSGIIISYLGGIGYLLLLGKIIKRTIQKKHIMLYLPLFVTSTVLFLLLVFGYQRGYIPNVTFEAITLQHILDKKHFNIFPGTSFGDAPNIRYGLVMAPFIALFVGFFASLAKKWFVIVLLLVCFQVGTVALSPWMLQFSIPQAARYIKLPSASWFNSHYTSGLVLTSATTNENFIFQSGLPYNDFIYEGTREYWTDSLKNPSSFASWIVFQTKAPGDTVFQSLSRRTIQILTKKFTLVYSDKQGYYIYHQNISEQ